MDHFYSDFSDTEVILSPVKGKSDHWKITARGPRGGLRMDVEVASWQIRLFLDELIKHLPLPDIEEEGYQSSGESPTISFDIYNHWAWIYVGGRIDIRRWKPDGVLTLGSQDLESFTAFLESHLGTKSESALSGVLEL